MQISKKYFCKNIYPLRKTLFTSLSYILCLTHFLNIAKYNIFWYDEFIVSKDIINLKADHAGYDSLLLSKCGLNFPSL